MGKLQEYLNKIHNYFFQDNSKEYQRVLSGIRIYFSMMKQRSFMNFLFLTIFMFFFILFIFIFSNIQKGTSSIISVVYNSIYFASFFIIFMLLLFLFLIYWQNDFKVIKGIKIFFTNPFSFFLFLFWIITIPLTFFQSHSSLLEIIFSILTVSIALLTLILFFSISFLKPQSLLKYASEKLVKTSENVDSLHLGKSGYYRQYYYSVLTYYNLIVNGFRLTYQDDIMIRTKIKLIPLLCSQGLIAKKENKEILIKSLDDLSEIDPFDNPDVFTNKMTDIENNIFHDTIEDETKKKIFTIFKRKTRKERLREYLFYIITFLSILSAIVNTFFRDTILSLLNMIK